MADSLLNLKEMCTKQFWLCVTSEFFGCFFFVFIAAGSAIRMDPDNPPSVLHMALSAGLTVSTVVMATFHTSGGLVNPALTVGFVVARKISILRGVFYFSVQVVGGICLIFFKHTLKKVIFLQFIFIFLL